MKIQAKGTASGMSLFTSVYAFNRITLVKDDVTFISKNSPSHTGPTGRNEIANTLPFVQNTFFFLLAAVFKAYPETVPQGYEPDFFLPTVSKSCPSNQVAFAALSQYTHSCLTLQVAQLSRPLLLLLLQSKRLGKMVSEFTVSFGGGSFRRCTGR